MTIHQVGDPEGRSLLIVPGAFTTWQALQPVLDGLQEFRLLVVALPGHDPQRSSTFTTVGEIADGIRDQVEGHVEFGLGFSIGGMVLAELVSRGLLTVDRVILDSPSTRRSAPVGWVMRHLMATEVRRRARRPASPSAGT